MARDSEDIQRSLAERTETVDKTIDVRKGPVHDAFHVPWSDESAYVEGEIDHLGSYFQLENTDGLTTEEIQNIGARHGLEYGEGDPSQGILLFWAAEAPTSDIEFQEGELVSTEDGVYLYKITEAIVMYAATASAYFNAGTRRYEIRVAAEAVARGSEYDAKANRINTLVNAIDGISGVTNEEDFEGGTLDQTLTEYAQAIRELPLGNSLGTPGGLKSLLIREGGSPVWDVAVVTPADIGVYERASTSGMRAAHDLYVLGSRVGTGYDSYTTVSTETTVTLENQPVTAVSMVLVNGIAASFSVNTDTTAASRGSTRATTSVTWTYPDSISAVAGNSIYIVYTYNRLITLLQDAITQAGAELFKSDPLVREGKEVPVTVEITVSSYGLGSRKSDVEEWTANWFQDPTLLTTQQKFIAEADPAAFKQDLEIDMGVTLKETLQFNRPDEATNNVQTVVFDKNEYPVLSLTVRSAE